MFDFKTVTLCFSRRNKVVNHFSIMLQRRLREQERGEEDEDEGEKSGKKKKKGGGRGGDLRIHDLEDELEMSSDDSDSSMGDGKEKDTTRRRDYCKTSPAFIFWFSSFKHFGFVGQMERASQR